MTTTTQPLYVQGMIVALVVVCVWFTFLATLGAAVWSLKFAIPNGSMQSSVRCVFLWIGLLILCRPLDYLISVFFVLSFRRCSRLLWMTFPITPHSIDTFFGMYTSPVAFPVCPSAFPRTELLANVGSSKFCLAFDALVYTDFGQGSLRERLLSLWLGLCLCTSGPFLSITNRDTKQRKNIRARCAWLSPIKNPIKEAGLWPRPKIFNQLHYSWRRSVRLFLLPKLMGRRIERYECKFPLIDLKGETPNKAEAAFLVHWMMPHRERLNKGTPRTGDAIVRTHGNMNRVRLAEMTNLLHVVCA